ncbi:uncharacterized protein LOC135687421 [Rhopilema esculentum]|uniref:uncharacterized protein LOC135687421 n=1 Tax=Rhopilema esculentum TaxID=499914 RepID=UPI0031CFC38E|eukprot:gene5851-11172_t
MAEAVGINDSDRRTVEVRYENLKACYIKKHCKLQKGKTIIGCDGKVKQSWMRVQNGIVLISVECNMLECGEQLFAEVLVGREKCVFNEDLSVYEKNENYARDLVHLDCDAKQTSRTTWQLKVDLDSVYQVEENGKLKEVYALCTGNRADPNMFELVTEVYIRRKDEHGSIYDSIVCQEPSRPFRLISEGSKDSQIIKPETKRKRTYSSRLNYRRLEEEQDRCITNNASFQRLSADTAFIQDLTLRTFKVMGRRDIGYHIPLKNISHKGVCKEGDIVGLFEDEWNKTYIERLDLQNFKKAKLAGVITDSYYLEGLCKEALLGKTEIIAVIGIVPVRVVGPVQNGDQLFAFPKHPGCATTLATIALERPDADHKPILLGQALESKLDVSVNEQSLVSSFVSVVNGIDFLATCSRTESMEKRLTKATELKMKKAIRRTNWKSFWQDLCLLIVLAAIGLSLWQKYGSDTLLRRSICKSGSFGEQTVLLTYSTTFQEISITGLEFKFADLNGKLYKRVIERKGDFRYFINYGRCCYNGVSYGNEYIEGDPVITGPEILSIGRNCSANSVAYYNNGRWMPLKARHRDVKIANCYGKL